MDNAVRIVFAQFPKARSRTPQLFQFKIKDDLSKKGHAAFGN
jgi:hypothetical protein